MADSNRIAFLYDEQGQSAWLDNLKRGYITSGELVAIRDRSAVDHCRRSPGEERVTGHQQIVGSRFADYVAADSTVALAAFAVR